MNTQIENALNRAENELGFEAGRIHEEIHQLEEKRKQLMERLAKIGKAAKALADLQPEKI